MLARKLLRGLDADDFDIMGIFGARHGRDPDAWRLICTYNDGKRHKARLFERLARAGQPEERRTWEFHHIVEGQHYADIDFEGRLAEMYADELPCVLIAKEEHLAYNRVLHIRETDELFRDRGLPADLRERSRAAHAAASDRNRHPELRARVSKLRQLYGTVYMGDPVLQRVADNVFDDAVERLR